jgi:eukaryotic-like serine/threonine-protein kinase
MSRPPETLRRALADQYVLDREIGRGATATVYAAEDTKHQRKVALKVLRPELAATLAAERFFREISIAAQLQHPHILPLLDSGAAAGSLYFVMPLLEGETLRDRLRRDGPLPINDVVRLLTDIADALAYAHGRGVIHRDIKPDNIMVIGRHALVMDFGVAKAVNAAADPGLTTGMALGTPAYMAPEQAMAEPGIDHRADLYALGVVGYEALTGHPPFTGASPQDVLTAQVVLAPEPIESARPDVPADLGAVIMRALAKSPADRWQSAGEIVTRLDPLSTPSGGTPPPGLGAPPPPRRWISWLAAALALIGVAALLWDQRLRQRPVPAPVRAEQLTFLGNVEEVALSPDGQFLAFVVATTSGQELWNQDLRGTKAFKLLTAARIGDLTWTGDGAEIGFTEGHGAGTVTKSIARLGGAARVLLQGRGLRSPDGKSIAVASSGGVRINIVKLVSNDTIRLVRPTSERWVAGLAWAAGSERLAVALTTPEANHARLVILSLDGKTEEVLQDSAGVYSPAWGADGRSLYYLRAHRGSVDLMRIDLRPNGSPASASVSIAVAIGAPGDSPRIPLGTFLSISADGHRAAFLRQERWSNLARMRIGGPTGAAPPRPFTMGTALYLVPRISADGRRIAVFRTTGVGASLGTVATDGNTFEEIASVAEPGAIAWAPDGKSLAFTGFTADSGLRLAVHDFELGTTRRARAAVGIHLDWGSRGIVIQSVGNRHFDAIDPTLAKLVPFGGDSLSWVFYPRVSPDGRSVTYMKSDLGGPVMRLISIDGSGDRMLGPSQVRPLGWSEDGRTIFVARYRLGIEPDELFAVPVDGGMARLLLTLPPGFMAEDISRDGKVLVVTQVESRSDGWQFDLAPSAAR